MWQNACLCNYLKTKICYRFILHLWNLLIICYFCSVNSVKYKYFKMLWYLWFMFLWVAFGLPEFLIEWIHLTLVFALHDLQLLFQVMQFSTRWISSNKKYFECVNAWMLTNVIKFGWPNDLLHLNIAPNLECLMRKSFFIEIPKNVFIESNVNRV